MFSSSPDSLLFRARVAAAVAVSQVAEAVSVAFPRPDAFRYWLGVFAVAFTFGMLPYWLSIHSLVGLWRRLGRGPTVALHTAAVVGVVRVFVSEPTRTTLMNTLGGDLGPPSSAVMTLALILAACSVWLKLAWWREMDLGTACGWRGELEPVERGGGELITTGVYASTRHPRYGQLLIGMTAVTLISNHGAAYAALAAAVVLFTAIAKLEDDELAARFGDAHEAYVFSVPRAFFVNPVPFLLQMSEDTRRPMSRHKRKRSVGAVARPLDDDEYDKKETNGGTVTDGNDGVERAFADDATEDAVPPASVSTPRTVLGVPHKPKPEPTPAPVPASPDPWAFTEADGAGAVTESAELDDAAAMLPDADELYSAMTRSRMAEAEGKKRQ